MQRTSVMDLRIGAHCKFPGCQQLDFLPFVCTACHDSYCLDHRAFGAHSCPSATADRVAPDCPKCGKVVALLPNEEPAAALSKHINAGCIQMKTIADGPRCMAPGCRTRHNHTPVQCPHCRGSFCVQHRVAEDHKCARAPVAAALSRPKSSAMRNSTAPISAGKTLATEIIAPNTHKDDIFTIRLWLAAVPVESLPVAQRHRLGIQPLTVKLNRRWSVGKAVDWICSQLGIRNDASARHRLVALHQPPQVVSNNLVLSESARWNDGTQSPDLGHEAGVALVPESILSSMNQQNLQGLVNEVHSTASGHPTWGRRCAEEVKQVLAGMLPTFAVATRAG